MRPFAKAAGVALLGVLLSWPARGTAEEGAPRLHVDPFAHPELGGRTRARGREVAPAAPVWVPELRATLVAEPRSFANLSGAVLRVGEQFHGYRLLEVRPFEAVFEKDGARIVLAVDSDEESPE